MPPDDGSDVGCSRIPEARSNGMDESVGRAPSPGYPLSGTAAVFLLTIADWRLLLQPCAQFLVEQAVTLVLVPADLAFLLHPVPQVGGKIRQHHLALALQQALSDLLARLVHLRQRRFLPLDH